MSEFDKLHGHLRECVDNDDNTGITEDGIEFNIFEWAFGLSVKAKKEHDRLVDTITEQDKVISELVDALEFSICVAIENADECLIQETCDAFLPYEKLLAKHKQSKGERDEN